VRDSYHRWSIRAVASSGDGDKDGYLDVKAKSGEDGVELQHMDIRGHGSGSGESGGERTVSLERYQGVG
jgi:hypothetical protein